MSGRYKLLTKYTTLLFTLPLVVALLPVLPAQAAGITSVQITAGVPATTAPPDQTTPYFSKTFDINYSGNGPVTLSGSADGTQPFMFRDLLSIGTSEGRYSFSTTATCGGAMGQVTPRDVSLYFNPGINHVEVKVYNRCSTQEVGPLYLNFESAYVAPPPPVVPPEVLCGTAKFFGVRGSGEHEGFGPTMDALDSALRRNVPGIHSQFVSYWAKDVVPWQYSYPVDYVNSVQNGADLLKIALNNYWKLCPNSYVILGGFSQGAEVVRKAFAELESAQKSYVASVVLFGDPLFNPKDSSINMGNYTPGFRGIDIALYGDKATKVPPKWNQRFQNYCTYGDPVCNWNALFGATCYGTSTTMNITCPHLKYVQRGWVDDSIAGVVAQLKIRHVL